MSTTGGEHAAPDRHRWRLGRALIDATDRGAGATRRVTDANRRAGIYPALLLGPRRPVEGHLVVRGVSLRFTPLGHPIGEATARATAVTVALHRRPKFHLFQEWGLAVHRTWQVDIEDGNGSRLAFALRRTDAAAVQAVVGAALTLPNDEA